MDCFSCWISKRFSVIEQNKFTLSEESATLKTLYLLRHAKAEQGLNDRERDLTGKGRRQAESIGRWMFEQGILPDRILSSPAKRARMTAEICAKGADYPGSIRFADDLYDTYKDKYIDMIAGLKDKYASVMIVGHNPKISSAVTILTGEQLNMSPCMLVCIEFAHDTWISVKAGKGILKWVQIPV
jgi:phosphohistidine phosphatase